MRIRSFSVLGFAFLVGVSGCGDDESSSTNGATQSTSTSGPGGQGGSGPTSGPGGTAGAPQGGGGQGGTASGGGGQGGTASGGGGQGGTASGGGGQGGVAPACGDGTVDAGEDCDDGNTGTGDGCGDGCLIEHGWKCNGSPSACSTTCGDGVIAPGAEACDDNNTTNGDGCADDCTLENGWACGGEPTMCSSNCGDGVVVGAEACDDSNGGDGDGCSSACAIEQGWVCSGMPSICALAGSCATPIAVTGDGFTWQAPTLDPYGDDLDNGDASCEPHSGGAEVRPDVVFSVDLAAGDTLHVSDIGAADTLMHVLDGACDSATACFASFDGIGAEEDIPGLVYQATNSGTVFVVVDSWGASSPTDDVNLLFEISPCGDGLVGAGEQCDDANGGNGDGCSSTCTVESGYQCTGEPSSCVLVPGIDCLSPIVATDGFTFVGTNLDTFGDELDFTDASCVNVQGTPNTSSEMVFSIALTAGQRLNVSNYGTADVAFQVTYPTCGGAQACLASFDGVPGPTEQAGLTFLAAATGTYYVVVESWFAVADPTDTYDIRFNVATCGDGTVEFGEPCDDGDASSGDGCSSTCTIEPGYSCTGSPSVCTPLPSGTCAAPIVVNSNAFQFSGTNIQQFGNDENYNPPASCVDVGASGGFDIVFRADMTAGQNVRVRELGTLDAVVHILQPGLCAGGSACVASYDGNETVGATYTATSDGPVYIVLEAWGNPAASTTFDIRIDLWKCGDGAISGPESCDDSNVVGGDGCSATCQCENLQCVLGACAGTVVTASATTLPVSIPDNMPNSPVSITIPVAATGTIQKMAMAFEGTQTYVGDFAIRLDGPLGGNLDVCTNNGSSGDNFVGTYFKDGAAPITGGVAPFTGVFAPEQPFSTFTGQSVTGNWTLKVADTATGDTGTVTKYDLAFCVTP